MNKHRPLLLALLAQAALFLPFPGHLPEWSDEGYTRSLASLPLQALLAAASQDVHPPLFYLLVHPFYAFDPETPIGILRLASIFFSGMATVALDRYWLRTESFRKNALALWVIGPSLLLYSRMARSYSLQVLLVVVALGVLRPTQRSENRPMDEADRWLLSSICASIALATDYVCGLALWAGMGVALWRSWKIGKKSPEGRWFFLMPMGVVAMVAPGLWENFGKWLERAPSQLSALNAGMGAFFAGASLVFGETVPGVGWVLALLITVPLGMLMLRGFRASTEWWMILAVAIPGFAGVAGWVGFSFVPARVLYLSPFLLLAAFWGLGTLGAGLQRAGSVVIGAWALIRIAAIVSYWEKEDFLNGGYVVPLRVLAEAVEERAAEERSHTVLVLDAYNTDAGGVLKALSAPMPSVVMDRPEALQAVDRLLTDVSVHRVLVLRNTHDLSPGQLSLQAERKLESAFEEGPAEYWLRYGWLQRLGITLLGWEQIPDYYLQLREFHR